MKTLYIIAISVIIIFQSTFPQTFEIRTVNKDSLGGIVVEMRETSGSGTPSTSDKVNDIVFGIKWLQSYGSSLDLNSSIITSYNMVKSGSRTTSGLYYFQAFGSDPTNFFFPISWTPNVWEEIMSINNNLGGNPDTGTFAICESGFDPTTDPNFSVNLVDYTPTITGEANAVPLPVELTSFVAKSKGFNIELNWQTVTEVNNLGFDIERAVTNIKSEIGSHQFQKIGFVNGNGNSNSTKNYSFIDKNPTGSSKYIYRLKQIDNDGTFSYSDEVEVELLPSKFEIFQNYPNPFNPVTNIKFGLPQNSKVRLDVYNIIGEQVATLVDEEMEAGYHNIPFDAVNLASGTYIYRIQTKDFSQTKKMLLIK